MIRGVKIPIINSVKSLIEALIVDKQLKVKDQVNYVIKIFLN